MCKCFFYFLMFICFLVHSYNFCADAHTELEVVVVGKDGAQQPDNFSDIELNESSLSVDDVRIYLPQKSHYVSRKKREENINQVLRNLAVKKPDGYRSLHGIVRKRREAAQRGFDGVKVEGRQLEPVVDYFVKKVLKKDVEVLGHEIQKERVQKVVTGLVSAGAAAGLSALIAYLGSLW